MNDIMGKFSHRLIQLNPLSFLIFCSLTRYTETVNPHLELVSKMVNILRNWLTFYATPKQVQVKSPFLAVLYLSIIIITWIAFLGSLKLDLRQVYQKSCPVEGVATTKVKGYLSTESIKEKDFQIPNSQIYRRVWDNSDLILGQDAQDGGFIAISNLVITPNQTRGFCVEKNATVACNSNSNCKPGAIITSRNNGGALTGKCLKGSCELSAWCPLEGDKLPLLEERALLTEIGDYTIMLKNSVQFPDCHDEKYRNILKNATREYLSSCTYHMKNDTRCPVFRLRDVVEWSGGNFSKVALTGGVFRIESNWNCDFDWDHECLPTYNFQRIDDPEVKNSPGLNFRIADYHEENRRTLTKVFGIKIGIIVSGHGSQFELLHLVLSFGATLGLFSVGALVCDSLFEFFSYLGQYNLCTMLATESQDDVMKRNGPSVILANKIQYDQDSQNGEDKRNA